MNHRWQHSGKRAESLDASYQLHDEDSDDIAAGMPLPIGNEKYLVRHHYLVPYFPPKAGKNEGERRRRERLNVELCDRVFRISDARDVAPRGTRAEAAIEVLKRRYEASIGDQRRGAGRILFARIVSHIRDQSRLYLEHPHDKALETIKSLYGYVMVKHPEIFQHVRLYDETVDQDGIIQEAFSEIGKPHSQSLESIYASRARKIGHAMAGIHKVAYRMDELLYHHPTLPSGNLHEAIDQFATIAAKLVGVPTTECELYDELAADYVNARDLLCAEISLFQRESLAKATHLRILEWLQQGVGLIHSMQFIRDTRLNSIREFERVMEGLR